MDRDAEAIRGPRRSSAARWVGLGALTLVVLACTTRPPGSGSAPPAAEAGAPPGPAAAAPAPTPTLQPVRVVAGTVSVAVAPLVVARERGFAARQGLDLEVIVARSGSEAMAALLSQDAPLGSLSGNALVNAAAAGADLVLLAVWQPRITYKIMAGADMRAPADLRGRRLGVADVGGSSDFAAQYFLDKYGLRRGEDVVILSLGSQTERLGGLEAGAIQAAMLNAPFTAAARQRGFHAIFDYAEEDYEVANSGLVTTRAYQQAQPAVARGMVTAIVDAVHYFKTEQQGTLEVIGRFLQQDDPTVLRELYEESAGRALAEVPYPSARGLTNVIAQVATANAAAGRLRAEDLIDDRYVRELDESGYIRALYGR
jgi:ABC-type nitrate/sulfonate/bicarbonate transport system substrate-binding protein